VHGRLLPVADVRARRSLPHERRRSAAGSLRAKYLRHRGDLLRVHPVVFRRLSGQRFGPIRCHDSLQHLSDEHMRLTSPILAIGCVTFMLLAGCGGGQRGADAGGGAAGGGSGGAAAGHAGTTGTAGTVGSAGSTGTGGAGQLACGSATCGANQICVSPSCGSGVQVCLPLGDAGQCPAGFKRTDQCSPGSGPGCVPPPCEPPPPFCVDIPSACGATPTCSCLAANVCQQQNGQYGGTCATVSNGRVFCLSLD